MDLRLIFTDENPTPPPDNPKTFFGKCRSFIINRIEVIKKFPEFCDKNKCVIGLAFVLIGLAFIPFTGGTSVITMIPSLAAMISTPAGLGLGSGLCGFGLALVIDGCLSWAKKARPKTATMKVINDDTAPLEKGPRLTVDSLTKTTLSKNRPGFCTPAAGR